MLAGRVAESGKAEWLAEMHGSPFARASVAAAEGLKSGGAFPVLVEGEVVGVLEAFSSVRAAEDTELMQTLTAIGAQLGQFLRRKRAEEERQLLLQRERIARAEAEAAASTLRKLGRVSEAALEHSSLADLLDARLLELIADRIAIAINQAALYEAERVAQDRLHFLGEASTLLASSLDVDATLARVAKLAVPHFADWCSVDLLDATGTINQAAIEHVDPKQVELAERIVAAIASGEAELSLDTIVVPLIARDQPLGALTFVTAESGRRYTTADLQFAQELAARAAVAVDNAHLYRAAERRRDRLAFLAEASELLGSSLDVDRTLERLGSLVAKRCADWVAIHLARDDGPARLMTVAHHDDERKLAAEAELQAFASDREPPLLVAHALASGASQRWSRESSEGGYSGVIVPLIARSRILGTLSLVRGETKEPYDDDDVEFAEDLARRAAIAIDNAQLYRQAEDRAQAARVLASVGDGVFFVDRTGVVRTWNRAAETATGLALADVVDRAAADAIPGWAEIVTTVPIVAAGSAPPRAESLPLALGGGARGPSI